MTNPLIRDAVSMNQIRKLVVVTVVAILFVVPSVTATPLSSHSADDDDVQLFIWGGIGIHILVIKPDNISITGNYTIYGQGIILKGNCWNETGTFILPEFALEFEVWSALPYFFLPVTVTLNAGGKNLSKSGFTFMWITILW